MPSFTSVASDAFTGANENPLSHDSSGNVSWTTGTGVSAMQRLSNAASPSSSAADCGSYWSGTGSFNANQYSRGSLTMDATGTNGGGRGVGLLIRQASGANTCYRFVIDHAAANNAEVARIKAGAYSLLGSRWTQSFTNADQFTFAVEGTGTSTVLYVYDKNGTQIFSFSDSGAGAAIDSGVPGIAYSSAEGAAANTWVDSWEGGNFTTAFPSPMFRGS